MLRIIAGLVAAAAVLGGCGDKGYSQETPEATLATARLMVEQGDARRLTELVYAESPELRELLEQAGDALESLARLGVAVQREFPEEVARLRAEAEAAAASGQASSFVGQLVGMNAQVRRAARTRNGQGAQDLFNKMAMEVMADPYAWITRNAERVSVTTIADDQAAVLVDGKPALGIGVTLIHRDGEWYFYLPVEYLKASRVYPDTPEEWEIMGYLMAALDNAVVDLTKDVEAGRARRLEEVARMAGEKAFVPAAMIVLAYGKAMDNDRKEKKKAAGGG